MWKRKQNKAKKKQIKKNSDLGELRWYHRLEVGKEKEFLIDNLEQLLSAGMSIALALDSIKKEMKTKGMKIIIEGIIHDIEAGFSLWKAMEKTKLYPDIVISLMRVGEESGRLSENFKVIVEQQQKLRSFKSKLRSAMMYPALVFVVTLTVGIGISWFILP
jgi:type IV pilus assembly protein PilC